MMFMGYKRSDGRVGVRNHVLILPTVSCSSETARMISYQVKGTTTFTNVRGCGQIGNDAEQTIKTLVGLGINPNVYGVVLIGLGCETAQPHILAQEIEDRGHKPVKTVIIQREGGTVKAIAKGVEYAYQMVEQASLEQRTQCDSSQLILGPKCGGSDPTSGIAANPALGYASDMIVKDGGTSILSETTEFIGAEHLLAKRAINEEVAAKILKIVSNVEQEVKRLGVDLRGGNPSPGNMEGGLTTIEEKSLGCIHKGGLSPIVDVIGYADTPSVKGLNIMDTPGYDVEAVTGMVAGGCQIIAFTTGLGTPLGNPIAPVIKITGNPDTYSKMLDNIDINAGTILTGQDTIESMGLKIYDEILKVVGGKLTKAEMLGFCETGIYQIACSV
ncbi:UxaA family hydrolase [Mahella sp.]|uniref:UxaA family hydrolase n=1 Tax=Mahella sp. TaxID=2798721 RepID=UPI0025BF0EDB|nr:UxaA family hydrolase [Mahella sp.]MBZ4664784.1 putative transcriptional regulator, TetR family [Mahella sp.]